MAVVQGREHWTNACTEDARILGAVARRVRWWRRSSAVAIAVEAVRVVAVFRRLQPAVWAK